MHKIGALAFAAILGCSATAQAQPGDLVLTGGKVLTLDRDFSAKQALVVRDGRILATGSDAAMRKLAGAGARTIDLGGRTVIPGLIDVHMHAIRAALTYATEVSWIGVPSLADALQKIKEAAQSAAPGKWIIVAGGWMDAQFKENRKPTQAELVAAAGDHPVYVQYLYDWAVLSPAGLRELGIAGDADVPKFGKLVRDADGKPTGEITGNGVTFNALFNKIPRPTAAQEVEGTKAFFRELNRLGLTGLIDPAGVSVGPSSYRPLMELWRNNGLTLRVSYYLSSQKSGAELADYENLTQLLPSGFGDDMLRFGGIGEIVTWASWTDGDPTDEAMAELEKIIRWAAARRMGFQIHWNPERTVDKLLTILERVNAETPLAPLRWAINHLYNASDKSLQRIKALGIGWSVQDSLYYSGAQFKKVFGVDVAQRFASDSQRARHGREGRRGHRRASCLQLQSVRVARLVRDGTHDRRKIDHRRGQHPTRAEALRMYTMGSAWFANADDRRGSLEPGKFADLAVLSRDYMTVPENEIAGIESLLTIVGGKIVYAAGPYEALEAKAGR